LSRDVERCTGANVYAVTKGLEMNNSSVSAEMKGESGNERAVRPEGEKGDWIRKDP
jgi:hypothetical protein